MSSSRPRDRVARRQPTVVSPPSELPPLGRRDALAYRHRRALTVAVILASVMTCVALATVAGWHAVTTRLADLSWSFLPAVLVAHVAAYACYVVAHHHVLNRARSASVGWRRGARLVMLGFGAWLVSGGFGVDRHALQWHGATSTEAGVSAMVLGLLEFALLAPAAWLCALLLLGAANVPESETLPWVIGVPLGALLAVAVAVHWSRTGTSVPSTRLDRLRGALTVGLTSALALVRHPRRGPATAVGIAAYWAADITALWAALRFLSTSLSPARLILAYATGYLLTRRALPLAGVVVIEAMLTISLVWVGVPLAIAVAAVLVYRLSDFMFTLGGALLASSDLERALRAPATGTGVRRREPASALP